MRDFREQNFYELLDVHPQASQQELDRAYQRARRIFNPDSVATYALFQPDELNLLRRRIEEAFRTLSDPERRAAYDQELARLDEGWSPDAGKRDAPETEAEVKAEDQPELDLEPEEVPIPQDESPAHPEVEATVEALGPGPDDSPVEEPPAQEPEPPPEEPAEAEADAAPAQPEEEPAETPGEEPAQAEDQAAADGCECPADDGPPPMPVLDDETEVTGALLLQARLSKGLSLDDYVQVTKISIYYLRNIENENFSDLPATVYVRGYLRQMAQLLGLDPQRVSTGYLERKARLEGGQGD